MKLRYKLRVIKQLQKIPLPQRKKIVRKLEMLLTDPLVGKPLRGELEGLRSLRAWPYRIVYKLSLRTITIYSVAHRQSAYKV